MKEKLRLFYHLVRQAKGIVVRWKYITNETIKTDRNKLRKSSLNWAVKTR